jgi:hypothetical protein
MIDFVKFGMISRYNNKQFLSMQGFCGIGILQAPNGQAGRENEQAGMPILRKGQAQGQPVREMGEY